MTRKFKYILLTFLLVFMLPLFSFPVFAEEESSQPEYGSYDEYLLENSVSFLSDVSPQASSFDNTLSCIKFKELTYAQQQAIVNLNHSAKTNNLVFMSSTGRVYTMTGAWFSASDYTGGDITVYVSSTALNDGYGGRWQIKTDGTLTQSSTPEFNGEIAAVFYWSRLYGGNDPFGNINFDANLCAIRPETTPPVFPDDDAFACNFALNEVISNDYVASLVAYAEKQNYSEPYFIYRVYYTDSADDLNVLSNAGIYNEVVPFSIKGYVLALNNHLYPQTYVLEYKQLRKLCSDSACLYADFHLTDSMMYPFYELVLSSSCLEKGEFSEIQATQDVNASIQQTILQNATSISNQNTMISQNQTSLSNQDTMIGQNEELIDSSNMTNELIKDGNAYTDSILVDSSNKLDDVNTAHDKISSFESSLFSNLSSGVNQFNSLTLPVDFALTASFVRTQFQDIWNYSPLGVIISFCLMIGVMSLVFGRKD